MTYYLSITIGRNLGDQPMNGKDWQQFKDDTKAAIYRHAGGIAGVVFEGEGAGIWDGDSEQAYNVAVIVEQYNPWTLDAELSQLASKYKQEAIARVAVPLPNGDETLVYASK